MALEVLGAVSSGFAVASFAGGTVTTIFKIKQQLDKMQNVPESIRLQLEYLEPFPSLIAEMEEAFRQSPEAYASLGTSQKCLDFLQKVLNILTTTVEKLEADLASRSKVRRNKAKIKAVLKADTIQEHYQRLGMALQMMNLCLHIYNTSQLRVQPDVTVAKLQATEKQQAGVEESEPNTKLKTGPILQDHGRNTLNLLGWQSPGIFGRVGYASKTWASKYETRQKSVLRMQLPWWLACKTWDFYVERAISGWHIGIQPISIIQDSTEIRHIIETASPSDFRQTLSKNGYSVRTCDRYGNSVLSLAMRLDRLDIALDLVRAGAPLNEPNQCGKAPISIICEISRTSASRVNFFRQLAQWDKVEDLAHVPLNTGSPELALDYAMWTDLEIFDLLLSVLNMNACKPLWEVVPWWDAQPSMVLSLFNRYEMLDSPDFLLSCANAAPEEIAMFVCRFLTHVRLTDSEARTCTEDKDWRRLCYLYFRHVPLARLSIPYPCYCMSPLVYGLQWIALVSTVTPQLKNSLLKRLRLWLQDLQRCGKDLVEYGKAEKQLLKSHSHHRHAYQVDFGGLSCLMPQVQDLDYGPNPNDWVIYWENFGPELARDFWKLVDPEPLAIPGSWVDD